MIGEVITDKASYKVLRRGNSYIKSENLQANSLAKNVSCNK